MTLNFRYGGFDAMSWIMGIGALLALSALCTYLFLVADGADYLAAWVTAIVVALVMLCLLSVPRRIILRDEELELRCLVETTYIPLRSVVDVEVLGRGLKEKTMLLGVAGLGGYLGFWLDIRSWKIHRVYVTHRKKCVAIHTSHRRYIVSCGAPELLRSEIIAAKARCSKEDK